MLNLERLILVHSFVLTEKSVCDHQYMGGRQVLQTCTFLLLYIFL
jgi:hypothetical protein